MFRLFPSAQETGMMGLHVAGKLQPLYFCGSGHTPSVPEPCQSCAFKHRFSDFRFPSLYLLTAAPAFSFFKLTAGEGF